LSPSRQIELLELLGECREAGTAQFIIATHSPILMSLDGGSILDFNASVLRETAFRDTPHFKTTRDFFRTLDEKEPV
jgi:predicted ATPase